MLGRVRIARGAAAAVLAGSGLQWLSGEARQTAHSAADSAERPLKAAFLDYKVMLFLYFYFHCWTGGLSN